MKKPENRLRITTESLNLTLEGDSDYVRRAYEGIRRILAKQFRDTMLHDAEAKSPMPTQALTGETSVDDTIEEHPQPEETFINLVICQDVYNKIYLVEEESFQDSFFSKIIDPADVGRIYVNDDAESRIRDLVDFGNTLWRELTPAGKAAVGRSD